jgi:hypothetical protein
MSGGAGGYDTRPFFLMAGTESGTEFRGSRFAVSQWAALDSNQ